MKSTFPSLLTALVLTTIPAPGIIVAGANGGSDTTNNTTGAQLDAVLGTSFGLFDNVIRYSDASGVYLGYAPSTSDVWVLSARHVTDSNAPITIDGMSYDHQQRHNLSVDLELNRYRRVDLLVPSLPTVPLATGTPDLTTNVVMIGFGVNRVQTATTDPSTSDAVSVGSGGETGYQWGTAGSSLKRWGTNMTSTSPVEPDYGWSGGNQTEFLAGTGTLFFTRFDEPGSTEWTTSNEGQPALFDSGSGLFVDDAGTWTLAGVPVAVFGTETQNPNTAAFGNHGGHVDIASARSEILTITGMLVPEPSLAALLLTGLAAFPRRRR